MTIHTVRRRLLAVYAASIALAVAVAVVFECDLVAVGALAGLRSLEYVLLSAMELSTIAAVPLALRLLRLRPVRRRLCLGRERALLRWGLVRLLLLCVPLVVNTLLYYLFLATAFGYLALIVLLCLLFVVPTVSRCHSELTSAIDQ